MKSLLNPGEPMLPTLSPEAFTRLASLLRRHFHLELPGHKEHLVHSRLGSMVRDLGFSDYDGWLDHVEDDASGEAMSELVNRLTTNFTWFNREPESFALVEQVQVNRWQSRCAGGVFRAWVAGCATGEEAWMLAMILHDLLAESDCQVEILATDISRRALEQARQATYGEDSLRRLAEDLRTRHFVPLEGNQWQVADHLRGMVHLHLLNLNQPAFSFNQPLDLIFCRNVMMYFDVEARRALVHRFRRALDSDGWLVIGQAEKLEAEKGWVAEGRAVFRRSES